MHSSPQKKYTLIHQLRIPILLGLLCAAGLWLASPSNNKPERYYSLQDYNQDMGQIYYDLGMLSQRRGAYDKALKAYTIALNHNPTAIETYRQAAFCYGKVENFDQAECMMKKVRELTFKRP